MPEQLPKPRRSIQEIFADSKLVDDALARGVAAALRRHKALGQSIVVWRDGKVVHVPAEQIEVPYEPTSPLSE